MQLGANTESDFCSHTTSHTSPPPTDFKVKRRGRLQLGDEYFIWVKSERGDGRAAGGVGCQKWSKLLFITLQNQEFGKKKNWRFLVWCKMGACRQWSKCIRFVDIDVAGLQASSNYWDKMSPASFLIFASFDKKSIELDFNIAQKKCFPTAIETLTWHTKPFSLLNSVFLEENKKLLLCKVFILTWKCSSGSVLIERSDPL